MYMNTFNNKLITNKRGQLKMSIQEAASKAQMSSTTLRTIEQGKSTNTKNIEKICDLLGLKVSDLYQGSDKDITLTSINPDAYDKISSASIDVQDDLAALSNEALKIAKKHFIEYYKYMYKTVSSSISNPELKELVQEELKKTSKDFISLKYQRFEDITPK